MNHKQPFVIFSAYLNTLSEAANLLRHAETLAELDQLNIGYRVLDGMYAGNKERSILVTNIGIAIELAFTSLQQESILITDSNSRAYLQFANESTQELGLWHEITESDALKSQAYTFDVIQQKYWIVK